MDIRARIQEHYPDSQVWVHEFSGGQDHFRVVIWSPTLNALKPLDRHRRIYALFSEEMNSGLIHAFSLQFLQREPTPGDFDVGFNC